MGSVFDRRVLGVAIGGVMTRKERLKRVNDLGRLLPLEHMSRH